MFEQVHQEGKLDLSVAKSTFASMRSNFRSEYLRYEIPYIATTIVAPLLRKELHMWRPLEDEAVVTMAYYEQFIDWQDILDLERGPAMQGEICDDMKFNCIENYLLKHVVW